MKFVLFYHSFTSCWNHGNAHFLRGITRELLRIGHEVVVHEPVDGWSRANALADRGRLAGADTLVPGVAVRGYHGSNIDFDEALADADVVIAHEWTAPEIVADLGRRRRRANFRLLFHDTHHRAVTSPHEIDDLDLDGFDGILAFGEVLRELYVRRGWGRSAFTWHEAADVGLFQPQPSAPQDDPQDDLIWIGNWGDGERSDELRQFLLEPVATCRIAAKAYGVRYPPDARELLRQHGITYGGWLPNHLAPAAYGRARLTIHVPRRPYVESLRGIPTIRVFEALACGVPLVSAPWHDDEKLFPAGSFLSVSNGTETAAALRLLVHERAAAAELSERGLATIRSRHTCAHRVGELLTILQQLDGQRLPEGSFPYSRQALVS